MPIRIICCLYISSFLTCSVFPALVKLELVLWSSVLICSVLNDKFGVFICSIPFAYLCRFYKRAVDLCSHWRIEFPVYDLHGTIDFYCRFRI